MGERLSIEPYAAFALQHYGERDSAHDAAHIRRILARLGELSIGVEPAPRADRLYFLACFHGLALRLRDDARFRYEVEALLGSLGWTSTEIDDGFAALEHLLPGRITEPGLGEGWLRRRSRTIRPAAAS